MVSTPRGIVESLHMNARSSKSRRRKEVVAAVIEQDGTVLIAQRRPGSRFGGLWEFPGGKVERGETAEAALCREIQEELGVRISVASDPPITVDWDYDHIRVRLSVFRARIRSGIPRALDHAALRWVAVADLPDLPLLPADQPVAARLLSG